MVNIYPNQRSGVTLASLVVAGITLVLSPAVQAGPHCSSSECTLVVAEEILEGHCGAFEDACWCFSNEGDFAQLQTACIRIED